MSKPKSTMGAPAPGEDNARLETQLEMFRKGAAPAKLAKYAGAGSGIIRFTNDQLDQLTTRFSHDAPSRKIVKFVPASGAATRMFKTMLSLNNLPGEINEPEVTQHAQAGQKDYSVLLEVITGLKDKKFAFCNQLEQLMRKKGLDLLQLLKDGTYKQVIHFLVSEEGLNYAGLPKALLKFHRYDDISRTAIEEHLVEGLSYSIDKDNVVHLHFTVSPEHRESILRHIDEVLPRYKNMAGKEATFDISLSEQKPSTDTVAVDMDNLPMRTEAGKLIFRPGGHGALIENLNDLECDVVFIKNIDNVVPDTLKETTIQYKKVLGGYLLELQTNIFSLLKELESGALAGAELQAAVAFARDTLFISFAADFSRQSEKDQRAFLMEKLNRPLRVCGMVKNEGEPGGGPFMVEGKDGTLSLQIVEAAQVDTTSSHQRSVLEAATHFNPVDLVCALKDYRGRQFDLHDYIDKDAFFISEKSWNGRVIKALEHPGLWNGAMADWITIFVEVPIATFNPTKTLNDLLRKEHQPA
ncbi:MAG: DUF4301 family protein [bacterium]|nr:DUF4301 family protein [bacterium]